MSGKQTCPTCELVVGEIPLAVYPIRRNSKLEWRVTSNQDCDVCRSVFCVNDGNGDYWVSEYCRHPNTQCREKMPDKGLHLAIASAVGQIAKTVLEMRLEDNPDALKYKETPRTGWTI